MQKVGRDLGPMPKDPKLGYFLIPLGVLIILPGFKILAGLPMFAVLGAMCILVGIHTITHSHKRGCTCPNCDLNYDMLLDAADFTCPRCGQYSVREGDQLVYEMHEEPAEEDVQQPQPLEEAAHEAQPEA